MKKIWLEKSLLGPYLKAIQLLSVITLLASCGKSGPIVLRGSEILRPIEFEDDGTCLAKETLPDGQIVFIRCEAYEGYYLISPSYLFEIQEELAACSAI